MAATPNSPTPSARNRYSLHLDQHFRHPTEAGLPIGQLVAILTDRDLHHHAD
jgi:hypothetical protein